MGLRKKHADNVESPYSASELMGFDSLYTPPPKKPGLIGTILRLPFRLVALPLRALRFVLGLPVRLVRRLTGRSRTET